VGTSGTKLVLGYLSQLREGVYYLEDDTATVPIDLTDAVLEASSTFFL